MATNSKCTCGQGSSDFCNETAIATKHKMLFLFPFPPLPPKKHVGYGALNGTIPPGASLEKTKAEFDAWEQTHAVLVQTVNSSMASNKTMLEHRSSAKFLGPFWILLDLMETCCLFPEAIKPTSKPACRTAEYATFKQGHLEIFGNCPSSQPAAALLSSGDPSTESGS